MSAVLTAEQALKLVGEMFVYHMPFNRAHWGWNWSVTKRVRTAGL